MVVPASPVARETGGDPVFEVSRRATALRAAQGDAAVVDASIGHLFRDDGTLWTLGAVDAALHRLPARDISAYAPFLGTEGFRRAVAEFLPPPPGAVQTVIATPGAAGAIYLALACNTRPGDAVLVPTPCWPAYATILRQHGRRLASCPLLGADDRLDAGALGSGMEELRRAQGRVTAVLNTPAHNPTGHSLDDREWEDLRGLLLAVGAPGDPVTLLVDVSYLEFAGDADRERRFRERLEGLPGNVVIAVAWSASKGFTLYGWRVGALVLAHPDPGVVAGLEEAAASTVRGTWGNPPRPGMALVEALHFDPALRAAAVTERGEMRGALAQRAAVLTSGADLPTLGRPEGFFAVVRHPDPRRAAEALEEKGVFVVPMDGGLRVALAGVPSPKVGRLAAAIADVIRPRRGDP
ncbi:aminotransferase class I/II-fold pyridoxal phosphate-dependent enzyme [Myxococcota bacterium]|nr:aminotransferase class I/II-fold pyridoxal phosphate-dependent enzyme [Myxococcota bacterium]